MMFWSRRLTAGTGVLLFVGVFALGAVFASPPTSSPPLPTSAEEGRGGGTGDEVRGQQIFLREGCVFCHSLAGYQPAPRAAVRGRLALLRRVGTDWSRNGPDLALEPGKRTDDWHLAHLLNPRAVDPDCPMPSYAGLPDDELRALIAFLQAPREPNSLLPTPPAQPSGRKEPRFLGENGVLSIAPTRASYLAGREVYRAYCAGCHGMEGNGAGAVGHLLWPEPRDFTDTAWMRKRSDAYLLGVIEQGKPGTAMPGYAGLLTAEERALVLYYLKFYANPSARQSLEEGFVEAGGRP